MGFEGSRQSLNHMKSINELSIEAGRTNHFRLQKREIFERIPLTAEVKVCVRGGPV